MSSGRTYTVKEEQFAKELESVISKYSQENNSNTPDFILAEYLVNSLANFNYVSNMREKWYGVKHVPGQTPSLEKIKEKLGVWVGEASMCWKNNPTGEFDSANASRIVDEMFEYVLLCMAKPQKFDHVTTQKEP
jgi:hypothetical protein